MIYLIAQLGLWLLLTAAFAAIAGWAFAAQRAAPGVRALAHERDGLLRDISRLAFGESSDDAGAGERESDAMRRLIEVRDSRIAELEQALSAARARADDAASRLAAAERALPAPAAEDGELSRLRALLAEHEQARAREVEVVAEPAPGDEALQAWRLRYFEQRVKYLEHQAAAAPAAAADAPNWEWRAREAQARADHLEQELRSLSAAPPVSEAAPFAANAEVDAMLRWRMLYLERRVAYLQQQGAHVPALALTHAADDEDRWKWRARYLEARLRHLQRAASPPPAVAPPAELAASAPPRAREKPPVLSAPRDGAPDDFTLIEDVSVLQQTTLYSLGVFHFDQIAQWTPEHVAWVDAYLRLRGRIESEEWVEQARDLARAGVGAARRMHVPEGA